jgi:hypothetical protein
MNYKIVLPVIFLFLSLSSYSREGMWIPSLLEKNISEMQQMGFKLSSVDIYSSDSSSMKDAIVHFGSGCTGSLISPNGLLVTNYHCGYSEIQSHSSIDNDILTNGFWALSREQELPNQGLTVTFLVRMEEVTGRVLDCTDTLSKTTDIDDQIQKNIAAIIVEEKEKTGYDVAIKPFFEGNQYYLFLTETFTDVRLVGAPPSSIGKFGGDTDNWMWPRHTGDFSLFRIYANKENKPAKYSTENVPYNSKSFLPINISGISEGDFTLVFGFPGSTQEYLPSKAVKMIVENTNPDRIAIRDLKLKILSDFMQNDQQTRIKYAAKYATTSNSWKKWQGEIDGLKRLRVVDRMESEEKDFAKWIDENFERQLKYGNILPLFDTLYAQLIPHRKAYDYYNECIFRGFDIYKNYLTISTLIGNNKQRDIQKLSDGNRDLFKNYLKNVDRELFTRLVVKYHNNLNPEFLPNELKKIFQKKNCLNYLENIYVKSFLTSEETMSEVFSDTTNTQLKRVLNDKLYQLLDEITKQYYKTSRGGYNKLNDRIVLNHKKYTKAQLEMNEGQLIYPDANSTLRVSYGRIEGFKPREGVTYNYFTTLTGVIEKENPEIFDFNVPEKLKELNLTKDFGRYSLTDSTMPVCFSASNHTSGGNSGSPVIDANGYLIGVNFDRNWEGTMSDIQFDPDMCRNISLDVRYMLFIIDKFANAGYLLNEMKIIE